MQPIHALQRWFRQLPRVSAVLVGGLAGSYLALWIVALILGVHDGWDLLGHWLGLSAADVLFRPWTLLTMAAVHRDPFHLAFNVLALASLGPHVERGLGSRRFAWLAGVATLSGSLLYVLWGLASGTAVPAIGASGMVLGVLVAFSLLHPEAELRLFLAAPLKARNLPWLILGIDLIALLARQPIAVACHLGGMLGAWAFLRKPWTPAWRRSFRLRWRRLTGGPR